MWNHRAKLLIDFSVIEGMVIPNSKKRNLSTTFPTYQWSWLNGFKTQVISFSRPWRIHLLHRTDVVVIFRSSMNALIWGCHTPDFVKGPLHSTLVWLDHPVHSNSEKNHQNSATCYSFLKTMPAWFFWIWCDPHPEFAVIIQDQILDLTGNMVTLTPTQPDP